MDTFSWILLGIFGVILVFGILPTLVMSFILYQVLLVRHGKKNWNRQCSMPSDPVQQDIFDIGMAWGEKHQDVMKPVEMMNDGLHLYGQYFDFGAKRAVIILPGRMESCLYSLFFAEPYEKAGLNVLIIDNRAHGWSDGKYNSLGWKEHRDVLKWAEKLHDELGIEEVWLHGCCIGAASAMFTATSPNCPSYVKGLVVEGMFVNFGESFKNHLIKEKKPVFPFKPAFAMQVRIFTGADILHDGPLRRIPGLQKPILMLHSKEDIFSLPDKAQLLYDNCNCEKKLVFFEHGDHSRIRYVDPEAYDRTIADFLSTH